jgi:hypothetical protein
MTTFDERDAGILAERQARRDGIAGPRVGDFVRMPDGTLRRFTYAWPDGLQTTMQSGGTIGFYLGRRGGVSYSGGLDRTIPLERIVSTDEVRVGWFWFFHHDVSGAGRGVEVKALCRVYSVRERGADVTGSAGRDD